MSALTDAFRQKLQEERNEFSRKIRMARVQQSTTASSSGYGIFMTLNSGKKRFLGAAEGFIVCWPDAEMAASGAMYTFDGWGARDHDLATFVIAAVAQGQKEEPASREAPQSAAPVERATPVSAPTRLEHHPLPIIDGSDRGLTVMQIVEKMKRP